ncbi:MAG TPA: DNA polymerase IV [Planctomycetaceae bacterium]|nr:DNA polymerase IV [Planctomycetaceae bacterium]
MILHVDMDAFYASVEERDRPELVGHPVIVGGTPQGRGVVAAANYVVRQFGVHSAMPTSTALRLCPRAIVLPPRIGYYAEVSEQIREILFRFTPLIEPLSLDEAFVDVTGSETLFGPSAEIGRKIKAEIRDSLRLVASVGVAPNKFLAKIASDLQKPDGFVVVDPAGVQAFLDPLPVGRLWGVGRVTGQVMEQLGVRTIGQVRTLSLEILHRHFGQSGDHLWELAHGIDHRPVVPDREAKSISHETTFPVDLVDRDVLRGWLMDLTEQVGWRLRRHELRGRTVEIKVRFADFRTIMRSKTLAEPTDITSEIWRAAAGLLDACLSSGRPRIRLLGVGVSGFRRDAEIQKSLFADEAREKLAELDQVADRIRQRFGKSALHRGSGLADDEAQRPGRNQPTDRQMPR